MKDIFKNNVKNKGGVLTPETLMNAMKEFEGPRKDLSMRDIEFMSEKIMKKQENNNAKDNRSVR